MIAKHIPPSAGRPRVLALDAPAARLVEAGGADLHLIAPNQVRFDPVSPPFRAAAFDALLGSLAPHSLNLPPLRAVLRPGGRMIAVVPAADRDDWLAHLARAGFVHLYSEAAQNGVLVRGERPPELAPPVDRLAAVAAVAQVEAWVPPVDPRSAGLASLGRYLHLLIAQTPNKPAWRLEPGDRLEWLAPIIETSGSRPATPAFTSLVRAVRFLQAAVLAGALRGINKVGKFPVAAAHEWPFHLVVNPTYDEWRVVSREPAGLRWAVVDWQAAVRGED